MININLNTHATVSKALQDLRMILFRVSSRSANGMSSALSSIPGVSEAGAIHGRFLQGDPASAQETLRKFMGQLDWIGGQLKNQATAFAWQDSLAAKTLDMLHVGINPDFLEVRFVDQPPADYQTLHFVPPVVMLPGLDISQVAAEINAIDLASVVASSSRWNDLHIAATEAVDQLQSIAGALASNNSGEAVDRAVETLGTVAATGTDFAANALLMQAHTSLLNSLGIMAKLHAATAEAVIRAIPDLAAQKVAERAAIASLQGQLQFMVDASLPQIGNLASPEMAAGGGLAKAGMNAIAGSDGRYGTDSLSIPKAMVDAAMAGQLGPGSFEVADGLLRPVAGMGAHDTGVEEFVRGLGRDVAGMFGNSVLPATVGESLTGPTAATLSGPGHGAGAGAGVPGGAPIGAAVPGGGLVKMGAAGTTPSGAGAGVLGGGWGGAMPGLVAGNTGRHAAGRTGGVPVAGGGAGGIGAAGGLGGAGGGGGIGGGGVPGVGGGIPGAGSGGAAMARGGVTPAGAAAQGGRSVMPVMGAGAGGGANNRGRVKAVTTKIEQDANKRALIGDLPPAIPGVIGAWVRE
ncbi:hypothetical protein G7Y31_03460 [Corynebacterium lizhenjunii]|uniref:Uncharacterized protein n=1 Tax=Corynebacterium lizhenjunii TaxID=2709394 RepID=A0A7T0PAD5_9CORY|nr:hypothetical protein [Corynebacterium lizhenjunii]QPK79768.1 hypothetical protein G7Y31_03460 [Corynebacterium lizhenjunii]